MNRSRLLMAVSLAVVALFFASCLSTPDVVVTPFPPVTAVYVEPNVGFIDKITFETGLGGGREAELIQIVRDELAAKGYDVVSDAAAADARVSLNGKLGVSSGSSLWELVLTVEMVQGETVLLKQKRESGLRSGSSAAYDTKTALIRSALQPLPDV